MNRFATALFFLLFSFHLFSSPEIICEEDRLLDEDLEIRVIGLEPQQRITIEASWIDADQIQWVSSAHFQANQNGEVTLNEQAPIDGSYEGIDSMGLFWSMEMGHVLISSQMEEEDPENEWTVVNTLRVLDDSGEAARKVIRRFILTSEVECIKIRENGLIGNLYIPPSDEQLPVVVVLTGSNGGIPAATAALFASNGIAAFALAYSGVGDLPPSVEEVQIEYFERAFEWIENHPRLNGKIALHGSSRGAELALLLGSMFPEKIDRIIAKAPSSVVLSKNSWIYNDKPVLPAAPFFIDFNNDFLNEFATRENARSVKIHRERGFFLEKERYDAAAIPVEKITCPIMLISGGDDQLGPCSIYSQQILDRLDHHGSKIERIHLNYHNAGHLISIPYVPRVNILCDEGVWLNLGGTPMEDELASRDSWEKTLEFLERK